MSGDTWKERQEAASQEYVAKRDAEQEATAQKFRDEWVIYTSRGLELTMPSQAAGFVTYAGELSLNDKHGNLLAVFAPGSWLSAEKRVTDG